jgi:hypothetical protein
VTLGLKIKFSFSYFCENFAKFFYRFLQKSIQKVAKTFAKIFVFAKVVEKIFVSAKVFAQIFAKIFVFAMLHSAESRLRAMLHSVERKCPDPDSTFENIRIRIQVAPGSGYAFRMENFGKNYRETKNFCKTLCKYENFC